MASQQQKDDNPNHKLGVTNFCKKEIDRDKTRAAPAADLIRQHGAAFGVGVLILLSRFFRRVVDDRRCSRLGRCLPRRFLRSLVTALFCELLRHNPRTPSYPKYRKQLETRLLYRFHIVGISFHSSFLTAQNSKFSLPRVCRFVEGFQPCAMLP
jgi:hypothetical protein